MDCEHCEMCDGPICGLPCSHYWDCYSSDYNQTMRNINDSINLSMMAINKSNDSITPKDQIDYAEKYPLFADYFRTGSIDIESDEIGECDKYPDPLPL